ncbi:MAG TPA: isochorismatase family protein [Baekduia sp.]|nr:isochorismatase family protein [Baekduia sp.]
MSHIATRSTKFLSPNHNDFELVGKPALVLGHMQRGLVGEGSFIPKDGPHAGVHADVAEAIAASGMVERCRELADAFRARDLPVIFVQAVPNPIGKSPLYGDFFGEFAGYRPYFTDEDIRYGLEVMPEMGYVEGQYRDCVLYNWQIHAFTNSGLDLVLKKEECQTIVWGGFAQSTVVFSSSLVAGDLLHNSIMPVDASAVVLPSIVPDHERLSELIAETVVRVMAPMVNQVTDTATVLDKLERSRRNGAPAG